MMYWSRIQIAKATPEGTLVSDPYALETNWDVGTYEVSKFPICFRCVHRLTVRTIGTAASSRIRLKLMYTKDT
jgi:hypothetical protein